MTHKNAAQTRFRKTSNFALILGFVGLASATTVHADDADVSQVTPVQFVQDSGASERINFSGKLRMLSQKIVATSCYAQAGIAPEMSRASLGTTTTEFAQILNALEFGDPDLGISGAEDRRRTLAGINKIKELWAPIAVLAAKVEAGTGTLDDVNEIAAQSAPLLDIAQRLVVQISGQYTGQTTVLQTDVFTIDIAGRQRMLAQRISKNICLISAGVRAQSSQAELADAAQNFENALFALRGGMPEAGINPPPNQAITDGLALVVENWSLASPIVADAFAGATLDAEKLGIAFQTGNLMTGDMNTVVGLYSEASKLDI
ncbi:type IV pili methyl-accepting chemotaxis transducer N-terminal domain-containing protein [Yoonia sp.]|nr:type IV pili methyl-accepting chemotaxis transducer N-terminal domain-containing protein [Yoonia sp.]